MSKLYRSNLKQRIITDVKDISIILVTFNSNDLTRACLESISKLKTKNLDVHVIVVDNASTEPFTLTKNLQNKFQCEILRSSANLGFTGGNNLGIHHAIEAYDSEYVLLLNNDTIIAPDALEKLVTRIDDQNEDKNYGIVTPKIYFEAGREFHGNSYSTKDRGKVLWYAGGSIDWLNLIAFHRGVDEVDRGQFAQQTESDFASGCCLLIKREVLEKIGLLDKRFFMYFEDVDWSVKAKRFGYKIGYVDEAVVWHINAGSSQGSGSNLHQYYQTRNMLLFFFIYGTWKIRTQVLKLWFKHLTSSNKYLKKAAIDFSLRQFGKQPIYF